MYFENINAFLKFKLNRSDVYSIEISSDAVTYDVEGTLSANADLGSTIKYVASTGHTYLEENVTIEVWGQNGMPLSSDVDYYIAIPAVEIEGLTIKVRGSGLSELFTNKKQSTFKAESNTIYNLGTLVAPPRSAEVGDYFYTDGTYSADYDSSKDLAGIVFYTGDPTASDATLAASEYSGCTHGLVVATEAVCGDSGVVKFCTKEGLWNSNGVYLNTIGVKYESNTVKRNEPYSNYMTGYNNTMALRTYDSASSAIKYCDDMIKVEGTSPWYIPTIAEFDVLYDNYDDVCASLNSLSYISFPKSEYWTVSEEDGTYVGTYKLYSKGVDEKRKSPISGFSSVYILPIFAF